MAHVHRQTFTKEIPAGAQHVTVKGVPCVRWKGRGGAWVVAEVIPEKPGRCRCQSAKWYVTYFDHAAGRERTVPGYTDRAATDAYMVELVRTAARVDAGLITAEEAKPRRPLTELLDRWHRYVRHNGAGEDGARRQRSQAQAVVDGVKATRPADLTPSAVLEWIGEQRESGGRSGKGMSAGTAANYLGAVKSFTRWLAAVEKCEAVDHLSALAKARDASDLRHVRRALSAEDLEALLAAARVSPDVVCGLTGPERHALYLTAASTGLRATELSRLSAADLNAEAETVTLHRPAKTKARAADVLPLEAAVVRAVRGACARTGPLWPNRCPRTQAWWLVAARMLRRDLAAAGIPYRDAAGRVYDFHALRGQFATDLDREGVSLARAQKLMRHSTPALTAKHYTRTEREELAADAAKLGRGRLAAKTTGKARPRPRK